MPRSSIQVARPALRSLPPRPSRRVQRLLSTLLPLALRLKGLRSEPDAAAETLARLISESQDRRRSLLLAFRHPSTNDPLVLADLLWRRVPRAARRQGFPLRGGLQLHFLFDRGIPLWAGPQVGWVLQRSGGIAIHRGRLDRPALSRAREVLTRGERLLAIAPEGATNNLSGVMAPLEPGVAQLAFWAQQDLNSSGQPAEVLVVPVGIRYRWSRADWSRLDQRLKQLQHHLGLSDGAGTSGERYETLQRIGWRLLEALEDHSRARQEPEHGRASGEGASLPERIEQLRRRELAISERHFGLQARGSVHERCRRIEQAAWDRMFRSDLAGLSAVDRALADWQAREADLHLGHMRLVEHFASVSGSYVAKQPSFERYAEVLLLLEEAITWIEARPYRRVPELGPRQVELSVGEPLAVEPRLGAYRSSRRQAVEALSNDLRDSLGHLMGAGIRRTPEPGPTDGSAHGG